MTEDEKAAVSNVAGAVSSVANAAIHSLKSQPGFLAVVILNALLFMLLFFSVSNTAARRDEHLAKVIDACLNKR